MKGGKAKAEKAKRLSKVKVKGKSKTVVAMGSSGKSNWDLLKSQIEGNGKAKELRCEREKKRLEREARRGKIRDGKFAPQARRENRQETRIVAVDCEMVGVGAEGRKSALARVVVVNYYGNVLLDTFCAPSERVTDYRTRVSGIRPQDLKGAPPFDEVQQQVATLLRGKVVVGHALKNDFKALQVKHPKNETRDTARYPPLRRTDLAPGVGAGRMKSRALKELAAEHLGLEIQHGEHSPVEDARAALYLYQKHRSEWEREARGKGKKKRPKAEATSIEEEFKSASGVEIDEGKLRRLKKRERQEEAEERKRKQEEKDQQEGDAKDDGYGLDLFVSE